MCHSLIHLCAGSINQQIIIRHLYCVKCRLRHVREQKRQENSYDAYILERGFIIQKPKKGWTKIVVNTSINLVPCDYGFNLLYFFQWNIFDLHFSLRILPYPYTCRLLGNQIHIHCLLPLPPQSSTNKHSKKSRTWKETWP